jgi:putative transposase
VNTYQIIVFEELEPQQMGATKGRGMRKSLADAAWNQLIGMTFSKAEDAGRTVVLVNPRDTTKTCSRCGKLVPKALNERVHDCPHCRLVLGRDHNAAINILARGLDQLRR